jgi:multidrug efflux pump subunit AcrA (membrane-fusion protein)
MKPHAQRAGAVAALSLALLAGCGRTPATQTPAIAAGNPEAARQAGPPPPPAGAQAVPAGLSVPAEGFLAVAVARHAVEVTAELDGELRSLNVAVGDRVEPGTRIGTIETREIAEQLASAQAALTALEAERKRSQIELESVKNQYERRAAYKELYPREQLEELLSKEKSSAAAVETAAARVTEERGHVAQLQGRLSHAVLTSPIHGSVATRYLDPGAIVRSGTPIVRLISAGSYVVRFAVPPEQSARLRLGGRIGFRPESHGAGAGIPGDLPGVISQISPQVDTASQMVFAEADLDVAAAPGAPAAQAARLQDGLVGTVRVDAAGPVR